MIREVGLDRAVILLGVASHSGDDSIGWILLRPWLDDPPAGTSVHLLRTPLQILDHLDAEADVVIVDACRSGASPGQATVLTWPDAAVLADNATLSHGLDVAAVLRLADSLSRRPCSLHLFAVEAGECRAGQELGEPLRRALDGLRNQLANLVFELQASHSSRSSHAEKRRCCLTLPTSSITLQSPLPEEPP